jgi:hypothetical protein
MDPSVNRSSVHSNENSKGTLICWKSVVAGVLVTFLAYMIFSALGAGIAGLTTSHIIEKGESASGLLTGAGLWIGGSAIVALFIGSYFATRFSEVTHKQIGASQAIVIAAIFFYLLVNVAGSSLGSLAEVAGHFSTRAAISEADAAAKAVGEAGWLLFVTLLLGVVAAVFGGIEGALGNVRRPFHRVVAK